jgi:hypothetical protein
LRPPETGYELLTADPLNEFELSTIVDSVGVAIEDILATCPTIVMSNVEIARPSPEVGIGDQYHRPLAQGQCIYIPFPELGN